MEIFIAGLVGIFVFYLAILAVGIWASKKAKNNSEEEMMLAGRNLGFIVGSMTLIATWVGGGYVNGAAEVMFSEGLLWVQVPVGYSIALTVGAVMFVKPMRDMRCVTLLDPFQQKYGHKVGGLLFIPTIFGDFFWVASILNALGSALVVITGLDPVVSVVVSAVFCAAYTSVGAMYSVTYTDVVQLFFMFMGLVLSAPFAVFNEYVKVKDLEDDWLGTIKTEEIANWIDIMLLLILGGIPWQGYMQRVLAIKSTKSAQLLSVTSMFGCAIMAVPPIIIGFVARSIDWSSVPGFARNITKEESSIILPLVLRHVTPNWVAFFGLGAISAAVMSSSDSSVLAFSAMFSRNIYKNLFRAQASETEVAWVLRGTVLIISGLSAAIALTVSSIYYLSVLSSDLIYVILFPQLLLIIYWKNGVNSYGCVASYAVGVTVRILGGEHGIGLPAVIKYPNFDFEKNQQRFPHRTLAMLVTLLTHIVVSSVTNALFKKNILSPRFDFLHFFNRENSSSKVMLSEVNEDHLQKEAVKSAKKDANEKTSKRKDPKRDENIRSSLLNAGSDLVRSDIIPSKVQDLTTVNSQIKCYSFNNNAIR